MRLTRYTDFALRTLMLAAVRHPARATVREVAWMCAIPEPHVRKIVHELARSGLLRSSRGRGGGFALAVEPDRLTVAEVVRRTERELTPVACLGPAAGPCPILPACLLRGALGDAMRAFTDVLERWTIADLIGPKERLAALLAGPPGEGRSSVAGRALARSGRPARSADPSGGEGLP